MKPAIISSNMYAARPYFHSVSPAVPTLFAYRHVSFSVKMAIAAFKTLRTVKAMDNAGPAEAIGDFVGGRIISMAMRPAKSQVRRAHVKVQQMPRRDFWRKNGMGGRSWITEPGQYDMIIVFHDANRAGPHIDVHIGQLSLVYRVKPELYSKLKYNNQGYLTEASRKEIINYIRSEVNNGGFVPQNLDHSRANARSTWVNGDPNGRNYGDGRTRQIVLETKVDVIKAHADGPIEFYAPDINPHRGMYIYRVFPGDDKKAPICVWGNRTNQPPKLVDRLHLKLTHPEDLDKLAVKADMSTSTAKYDGSSCYFVITKDGTTVWSPRQSVKTGEQIEYTHKLDGISQVHTSEGTIVGMGEVLFSKKERNPFRKTTYLSSAEGSGILNAQAVLPDHIQVEIRIYRIDKVGRTTTYDLDFWENRDLQHEVARLDPDHFKVVELMDPDAAKARGFEGVVVVPENGSVNDGFKVKWWQDANDWRIDRVEFREGEKGGVAGVVYATSLDSGKEFKLGPSQVGNQTLTREMMADPQAYEGTVLKVQSRHGHEGRAAKVVAIHDDKGLASY